MKNQLSTRRGQVVVIDYRLESVGSSDVILSIIIGSAFSASVWMFKVQMTKIYIPVSSL